MKFIWGAAHKCTCTLQQYAVEHRMQAVKAVLTFALLLFFTFIGSSITMFTMPSPLAAK